MEILQTIVESLNIDFKVVIAQFIAFGVLLVLLKVFLYKPIEGIMRQRREQIAGNLDAAAEQQTKAEGLRAEYEGHLAKIADEAHARLELAMKDAEVARQRMLEAAHTDIQALHERHQAQLELDREQLRRDLRNEMADIAVMAATKALRNQLTPDLQSAVVNQVISELDQSGSQQMM